jgi:hypothetical protein
VENIKPFNYEEEKYQLDNKLYMFGFIVTLNISKFLLKSNHTIIGLLFLIITVAMIIIFIVRIIRHKRNTVKNM